MIAAKAPRAKARTRNRLMASGAMGMAIGALMLAPYAARAQVTVPGGQAFQGSAQVVAGGATVVQTATQDTITVSTPQAVINWTPNDRNGTGTIDFLPVGLRGLFIGDSDFTVLNRIIPLDGSDVPIARMIALNGIIDSQIRDASGFSSQGGNVWFYSPGGILVGNSAVINVGSLLLTSRDIDTSGGLFGPTGEIRFRNPALTGATGAVEIEALAQITARNSTPGSAYIAMVAPRVVQAGTVQADGSIALVAAEQADMRINQGLFDINVTVGTDDPHGIIHTGTTGGPSESSATYASRAYLVAVPKNQAITMLLSGTIGYETASSVSISANGGIVLSAGHIIHNGVETQRASGATGPANISITDSRFANNLSATATGTIQARPNQSCQPLCSSTAPNGQLLFGGNTRLSGATGVNLSIGQAQRIVANGDLQLLSATRGAGGSVSLSVDAALPPSTSTAGGGIVQIAGSLLLDASAAGDPGSALGNATGGTAILSVSDGILSASAISVRASATGAVGTSGDGGNGTGGTATVTVQDDGILFTSGGLDVNANGRGGSTGFDATANPFVTAHGGDGTGGTAQLIVNGGTAGASQGVVVSANGDGGAGFATSGDGRGGSASLSIDGTSGATTFSTGFAQVTGRGRGGGSNFDPVTFTFVSSPDGGDAFGGTASFSITNTSSSNVSAGFISVDAGATGGVASQSAANPGPFSAGNASGGVARFSMFGNGTQLSPSTVQVVANAIGGTAIGAQGLGGSATGGSSLVTVGSGTSLLGGQLTSSADGFGGTGDDVSGDGSGGLVGLIIENGATLRGSSLRASATGLGGNMSNPNQSFAPNTNIGGEGSGGLITVSTAGTVSFDADVNFEASGFGGDSNPAVSTATGLRGGNGNGGTIDFEMTGGTLSAGTLTARTNGTGGSSGTADGITGYGRAGSNQFSVTGGSMTISSAMRLEALGLVNLDGAGAVSDVSGGLASLSVGSGGFLSVDGDLTVDASGIANAFGFVLGDSDAANGGTVGISAESGGTISVASLNAFATARAANSLDGDSGAGSGGLVTLSASSGGSISAANGGIVDASGYGGSGANPGSGTGGSVGLTADGGTISLLGNSRLAAGGVTGAAFDTGVSAPATGGTVSLRTSTDAASALRFGFVTISADGDFATLRSNSSATAPGGIGLDFEGNSGDAEGGSVTMLVEGGTLTATSINASASGYATDGGTGTGGSFSLTQTGGDIAIDFFTMGLFGVGGTSPRDSDNSDARPVSGTGIGGTATVVLSGGTLTGDFFAIDADGEGGLGVAGTQDSFLDNNDNVVTETSFAGDGGDGLGGSIEVEISGTASVSTGFLAFGASGRGGDGGAFLTLNGDESYTSGSGGNGTGGSVVVNLVGGSVDSNAISAFAGANGGDGGRVSDFSGNPINFVAGPADTDPLGGNAIGGTASVRLTDTAISGSLVVDASASAGEGGSILRGYTGGNATGGLAELVVNGADGGSIEVDIFASALGGRGGRAVYGDGGDGGDGFGGTARVVVANGGTFTLDANSSLVAEGRGGFGRLGNVGVFGGYPAVENGFDGGDGGDGFGGTAEFSAIDSDVVLGFNGTLGLLVGVNGIGGRGGDGANNNFGAATTPTFGGDGGDGGFAGGGAVVLRATGGEVTASGGNAVVIDVLGERGVGGLGGSGTVTSVTDPMTGQTTFFGGNGNNGFDGFTLGGIVRLEASDTLNGLGLISLSSLDINASGDFSGRLELVDDSSGAGISLGSLLFSNAGSPLVGSNFAAAGSGVYMRSRNGAIRIGSSLDLLIDGRFQIDAFGTGGLDVNGSLSVSQRGALFGIVATHDGRTDSATIVADSVSLTARQITLGTGTLVRTRSGSITLTSLDTGIAFDKLDAALNIDLSGQSISGSSAVAAGAVEVDGSGNVDIETVEAGEFANLGGAQLRIGDLTTITGYASLIGGSVTLDSADINTSLSVTAQSGDAIIGTTRSGAYTEVTSLQNIIVDSITTTNDQIEPRDPSRGAGVYLNARGSLSLGTINSAGLVFITADSVAQSTTPTPSASGPSSISAAGSISIGTAGDIDFGSATADSITLFSTDGSIQFGSTQSIFDTNMTATIGSITGNSMATQNGGARLLAGREIRLDNSNVAQTLSLTAGAQGINLGTSVSGYDTVLTTTGNVSILSATTTDIGANSAVNSANIVIDAGGNVDAASLTSAENIRITATALTNATSSIVAVGDVFIDVDVAALFGTVDAGSLTVIAGTGISFNEAKANFGATLNAGTGVVGTALTSVNGGVSVTSAGGNISLDTIEARFDAAVTNTAGGVTIGSVTTDFGGVFVDATDGVEIELADSGGQFEINSDNDIVIGTATVFGDAILDAGTDIVITNLTTTGQTSSQSTAPTNSAIRLRAGGDVVLGSLDAIGAIQIDATRLVTAPPELGIPTFGEIKAGEDVVIDVSGTAAFARIEAGGLVNVVADGVDAGSSSIIAGSDVAIQSFGDADLGSVTGEFVSISADDDLRFGSISGALGVNLGVRTDIDGGSIDTGGFLSANSAEGNIAIGTVAAHDGAGIFALGDIRVDSLNSVAGDVSLDAGDSVDIGTGSIANSLVSTSGNNTAIGTLTTGGTSRIEAGGDIDIISLTTTGLGGSQNSSAPAGANIVLRAGGDVELGSLVSAEDIVIQSASLSGVESSLAAADSVELTTTGAASFGALTAQDSATIDAGGELRFGSSQTQGSTSIRSGGPITGGELRAESGTLSVTTLGSSSVELQSAAGGSGVSFVVGGNLAVSNALSTSSGSATIDAAGNVALGSALVGGVLTVDAGGSASIGGQSTATDVNIDAAGDIILSSFAATGSPATSSSPVTGGDIRLNAGGTLSVSGDLDAANAIFIDAGRVAAAERRMVASGLIDITTDDSAVLGSLDGGFVTVESGDDIDFDDIVAGSGVSLTARFGIDGGSIDTGGAASLSSAEGGINVDSTDARGNITLAALQGGVRGAVADSDFGSIRIDARSVDFGELYADGGSIAIFATNNVSVDLAVTGAEGGGQTFTLERNGLTGTACEDCVGFGNDILINAGGIVSLGQLDSAEDIVISGAALTGPDSRLNAAAIIEIDILGNAEFGSVAAAGSRINIDAGGTIVGGSITTTAADSSMNISGNSGLTIDTIRAADAVRLDAAAGAIVIRDLRAGGFIDAMARSIDLTATDSVFIDFAGATAGDVRIRSTSGTLDLNDSQATGTIQVSSSNGQLLIGRAQANAIDLQSDTGIAIRNQAAATQGFTASARDSFIVGSTSAAGAVATGATITIVSGDVVVLPNGRIGTGGTTTSLTLVNGNNGRQTFIGGGDTTAGYSLSASELTRLFGGSITIRGSQSRQNSGLSASAPGTALIAPSSQPNVIVDSFALTGGGTATGNIGASGSFTIESPGYVRVVGTAAFNNMTSDNRFAISAEDAIQVIMGQGAIRLNGSNGLSGILSLSADDIVVATSDAISDIATLSDSAAIDERLAQNDGMISDEGALSANSIRFDVSNGLYVQNSGDGDGFDDRRGFTAGSGGVTISTGSSQSTSGGARIVINGVIDNGDGSPLLTGVDAFERVTINGTALTGQNQIVSGIDGGSTLNGCLIVSASNCFAFELDVVPPLQDNPLIDEEDEESEQGEGEDSLSVTTVIEIKDVEPLPNEPLIDDPVTGSPNDDLWAPEE